MTSLAGRAGRWLDDICTNLFSLARQVVRGTRTGGELVLGRWPVVAASGRRRVKCLAGDGLLVTVRAAASTLGFRVLGIAD